MAKAPPPFAVPKTLGACADALYTLRAERLAVQKMAAAIEAKEKAIKEHVIATLPKSDASGICGKIARVSIDTGLVPVVTDWPAFYAYIAKEKAFEMMQKRLVAEAINERWDTAREKWNAVKRRNSKAQFDPSTVIPGVGTFNLVKVSVTKL